MKNKFKVTVNGRKRYFPTMEAASSMTQRHYEKTGVILGIEHVRSVKQKRHACKSCRA